MVWGLIFLAVAVAGLALFTSTRAPAPGAGGVDATGYPVRDRAPSPDSRQDALNAAIGKTVSDAFATAALWLSGRS